MYMSLARHREPLGRGGRVWLILKFLPGGIEVAEFKIREFLPDVFQQFFQPHRLTDWSHRVHYLEVSQGIKIQIAPLNHVNRTFLQEPPKGADFLRCVAKSGTV